jgi:hypothetical protein
MQTLEAQDGIRALSRNSLENPVTPFISTRLLNISIYRTAALGRSDWLRVHFLLKYGRKAAVENGTGG